MNHVGDDPPDLEVGIRSDANRRIFGVFCFEDRLAALAADALDGEFAIERKAPIFPIEHIGSSIGI